MSKNSKNASRIKAAKTRNRKNGFKGPSSTVAQHTKRRSWYHLGNDNIPKKRGGPVDKAAKSE